MDGPGPPPRRRHRPATPLLVLAGVSVAAVVGLLALALAGGGSPAAPARLPTGPRLPRATPASAPQPASRGQVAAGLGQVDGIAAVGDRLAVVSRTSRRVALVRTDGGRLVRQPGGPRPGGAVGAVSGGFGFLWVARVDGRLLRYRPSGGGRVGAPLRLGPGVPVAAAPGAGSVWVASRAGDGGRASVTRVNPATGASSVVPAPRGVRALACGAGAVWVLDADGHGLTRLDPRTLAATRVRTGARRAVAVGAGTGGVWVADAAAAVVSQVDPATREVVRSVRVGRRPQGVAVAGGSVWVANGRDGTVSRLDTRTGRRARPDVAVGPGPLALAARGRDAWVALPGAGRVVHLRAP